MKPYRGNLQSFARRLRNTPTKAEHLLWFYLRKKQIRNIQFYRQKILGNYIVDFYAPKAKLIVELDGAHHYEPLQKRYDIRRDTWLKSMDLSIFRFNNLEVIFSIDIVLKTITQKIDGKIDGDRFGDFIDLGWL